MTTREQIYQDANMDLAKQQGIISPSQAYYLVIDVYTTGEHTWNYTRGRVYRIRDNALLADVKRNYGEFWYAWAEGHPDGNDLARQLLSC